MFAPNVKHQSEDDHLAPFIGKLNLAPNVNRCSDADQAPLSMARSKSFPSLTYSRADGHDPNAVNHLATRRLRAIG